MLYAILCYHDEDAVGSWTKEQDAAVMKKLTVVQDKLTKQGRLGPVARLLPSPVARIQEGGVLSPCSMRTGASIRSRRDSSSGVSTGGSQRW